MNKYIAILGIIFSILVLQNNTYSYDTLPTASVVLAGGIIKAQNIDNVKKYKRKDCPVCKGSGWYISGDGISRVTCGYCEPETKKEPTNVTVHPPVVLHPPCTDGKCKQSNKLR